MMVATMATKTHRGTSPLLVIEPERRTLAIRPGMTVLEASLALGIPHVSLCGGKARCSTCRVAVDPCAATRLEPRTPGENALARKLGLPDEIRLACQARLAPAARTSGTGTPPGVVRRLMLHLEDSAHVPKAAAARSGSLVREQAPPAPGTLPSAGREIEAAVLFADLRQFTTFSEHRPPYDVIYILDHYVRLMEAAVGAEGGRIQVWMGDGFLAVFEEDEAGTACGRAIRAALAMHQAMPALNARVKSLRARSLRLGVGIHFGPLVEGGVGPRGIATTIGDTVNTASRIEAMTKETGASILVSQTVHAKAHGLGSAQGKHRLRLRGRRTPITLVEIEAIPSGASGRSRPGGLLRKERRRS